MRALVVGAACLIGWLPSVVAAGKKGVKEPKAVEIAERVMERMGGRGAWEATRFIRWNFGLRDRMHYWDRYTGDIRIEEAGRLTLMNINTLKGRVWIEGNELEPGVQLDEALTRGHEIWVNDSYWMFMPYKLLDPGVHLRYLGEREWVDGTAGHVLELTFVDDAGYTPENRYEVLVGKQSGLVESWSFFPTVADPEPRFTMPWAGWQQFGKIRLATDHGQGKDWKIAVFETLPESVFKDPAPVRSP